VLVATTSGVSAAIAADGSVQARTPVFRAAVLVERIELRATTTLATRVRSGSEWALAVVGVVAIGCAVLAGRARRGRDG
jgi:apolipoprotein N-acyltransferase